MTYIFQQQNLETGLPIAKTLIKYISNSLEEMKKKRKNQLILSLLNKKIVLKLWKCYWLRWSGAQEEDDEDIAMANFIENYKSKLMRKIFKKWLNDCLMIAVSYQVERKIKKIFLEVISNKKNFYIKFCSLKLPMIKILQNLQGTEKRRIR